MKFPSFIQNALSGLNSNDPDFTEFDWSGFENKLTTEMVVALLKALKTNCTLQSLCLNRDNLSHESIKILAETLEYNSTLTSIGLGDNALDAEAIKTLATALKINTTLRYLNLSSNNFGIEGVKVLTDALNVNATLTELDLKKNKLNGESIELLTAVLAKNTGLQSIDLSENNLGPEDMTALAEALKTNTALKILKLAKNSFENDGIIALAEALKINKTLDLLDLSQNTLNSEGVKMLSQGLKKNMVLKSINFSECNFDAGAVKALADAFKMNRAVKKLLFWDSPLDLEGVIALAEALKINTTLEFITFSGCNITSEGIKALANALKLNTSLKSIKLTWSKPGAEGFRLLIKALTRNTTLTSINLAVTNLDANSLVLLAKLLKKNTPLTNIELWGNDLKPESALVLAEALKNNTTLTSLDLKCNNFSGKEAKVFEEALQDNFSIQFIEGLSSPELKSILTRNIEHSRQFNRLSYFIDMVFDEKEFSVEEQKEFEALLTELPKTSPYMDHPFYQRRLARKIEPFLPPQNTNIETQLLRVLQLINTYQFNFILVNQKPEEFDLKPNTVVFLQTKQSYYNNFGVQVDDYGIDVLFFRDHLGKLHQRKLNDFNLHYFMKVNKGIPLSTASIIKYQSLIELELHVRGIVRKFDLRQRDTSRLLVPIWSQVTDHPFYKFCRKEKIDSPLFMLVDLLTRLFNDDVAQVYYEDSWLNPLKDKRTIDDSLDYKTIDSKLNVLGEEMRNYSSKEDNLMVMNKNINAYSSNNFFSQNRLQSPQSETLEVRTQVSNNIPFLSP